MQLLVIKLKVEGKRHQKGIKFPGAKSPNQFLTFSWWASKCKGQFQRMDMDWVTSEVIYVPSDQMGSQLLLIQPSDRVTSQTPGKFQEIHTWMTNSCLKTYHFTSDLFSTLFQRRRVITDQQINLAEKQSKKAKKCSGIKIAKKHSDRHMICIKTQMHLSKWKRNGFQAEHKISTQTPEAEWLWVHKVEVKHFLSKMACQPYIQPDSWMNLLEALVLEGSLQLNLRIKSSKVLKEARNCCKSRRVSTIRETLASQT